MAKSILDPSFKYTPSTNTDIRERFNKVRKELGIPQPAPKVVVLPIKRKK